MRRRLSSAILPLMAAAFMAMPAQAGILWCRTDPIVELNGTRVNIIVAIPNEYQEFVNGPVQVRVKTPDEVTREVIWKDPGFNGKGEEVSFKDGGGKVRDGHFPTTVRVKVPFDEDALEAAEEELGLEVDDIPMRVEIIPANAETMIFEGAANGAKVKFYIEGQ